MSDKQLRIVTGAGGFIGGALFRRWRSRTRVLGCDFRAPFMHPDALIDWLKSDATRSIEGIVHLGACTDTRENDRAYLRRVNTDFTEKLWNHCVAHRIPFFYASSAATYGEGIQGYADEESAVPSLNPLNPYAESKQAFDLIALSREKAGSAPPRWAGFKFFNVYGFDERLKGPMASVVHQSHAQIRATRALRLFESDRKEIQNGHQMRDFVFVEDVLDMIDFAFDHPRRVGIVNVGSGNARSFLDLGHAAFDALKIPRNIEWIPMPEALRGRYQYWTEAPLAKIRALGFTKATTSLEEGVRRTFEALESASGLKPSHEREVENHPKDRGRVGSGELPLKANLSGDSPAR